eukprot:gene17665-23996_t
MYPVVLGIKRLIAGEAYTEWNVVMATAILAMLPPALVVILMQKCYGIGAKALQVIHGVTAAIADHEFIVIVGPSGCGKSTFMKLATGLRRPSKGTVEIAGKEVTGPLKITGMAFQASSLLPWRTTVQNVMLPLEIVEPY